MGFAALLEVGLIFATAALSLGLGVCFLSRKNAGGLVAALAVRPAEGGWTSLHRLAKAVGEGSAVVHQDAAEKPEALTCK